VHYWHLKKRIREGVDEEEFLLLFAAELERWASGLSKGDAIKRDKEYLDINQTALDKISKKFDKKRNASTRERNWALASERIGAFQLDLEPCSHVPSASSGSEGGPSDLLVFVAGAASGMTSRTLTAPLDRIKLVLQANELRSFAGHAYAEQAAVLQLDMCNSRILAAFNAIRLESGWRGFWRGNGANVVKVTPESGVRFLVYHKLRELHHGDPSMEVFERFVDGAIAGGVAQAVVYPMDVCKTRFAISRDGVYRGYHDCFKQIIHTQGFPGLYRGLSPAVLATLPGSGIDLMVYNTLRGRYTRGELNAAFASLLRLAGPRRKADSFRNAEGGLARKQTQSPGSEEVPVHVALTFGAMSSSCGCVAGYPFSVIRTRLIAQGMPNVPAEHVGWLSWWTCGRDILYREGLRGLYNGLLPTMLKTVPAISIGYGTFESVKRFSKMFNTNCL